MHDIRRREFVTLLGSVAVAYPRAAHAQQRGMPVIGFVTGVDASTRYVTAFREGLNLTGIVEGQNAAVEYHWLYFDRLPSLMADLVRRRVAVIATPGNGNLATAVSLSQSAASGSNAAVAGEHPKINRHLLCGVPSMAALDKATEGA
jgi:hypothetical protein